MAKKLVIVESPAKAKTINKYLGGDYKVLASIGHIKDLPPNQLGVDIEKQFEPRYILIPDEKKPNNKKIVSELKKQAKESEAVYLAADPDREGEAICQHLKEEIVKDKKNTPKIYRVRFNEITEKAIREAFAEPKQIDENLVNAQKARRVLDRLVGYMVSPFLWKAIGGRLSAGRVQTVALRLIVEREREIESFVSTEYWTIAANLSGKFPPDFQAKLYQIDEKSLKTSNFSEPAKPTEYHIKTQEEATALVEEAEKEDFIVQSVTKKERKRKPVPPFITSKLQQEAAKKFGFSASRTMRIAQRLYEGIELGEEGPVGLITYMRTDSTRISEEALNEVRSFIRENLGDEYLPSKPNIYKTKKTAQDAHEAIRPTSVNYTPERIKKFLTDEEYKLYTLIWKRFVASQMSPAVFDQTTIDIKAGRFLFRATGSIEKFDGFLKVYQESKDDDTDEDRELVLPEVQKGEKLKLNQLTPEQHFTEPPPRYTEASLVKALEEKGIGRPSTYATIISTIQERDYVEKKDGKFYPTKLGITVNDLLTASFNDIFDETYTAKLETQLDEIEEGRLDWREALKKFYEKFIKDLEKAKTETKEKIKIPADEICEKCGAQMVIKSSRFGRFLACSNYPDCRNKRNLNDKLLEETCPECGSKLISRKNRYTEFIKCSSCNYVKRESTGFHCPECEKGEILVRRSKQGRIFYSCSNYPECKAVFWNKPVDQHCPSCDAKFLLEKQTKKEGKVLVCQKCGHKQTAEIKQE
ncbi:MAG: type I DNA topoisomerase [Pyrinomonadaceae bacterium]|nr:type I DNA topoisomerase [Pyrinomonadaceae bacterium]MCX7640057.1 type I DNA topoisomerase [Pyrinomonadaceae bacterium]MDW8304229.1 type I DNA topoisomerase [Acidobacteriota bacterium]